MISDSRITAEEFAATKLELPEAGRWHELHDGRAVVMEPPDDAHGTTVMNLSKAIARWIGGFTEPATRYVCPEIGLKVGTDPDSVYCPALSFFDSGEPFEEFDKAIANRTPKLVIDLASANDRRAEMRIRTLAYIALGAEAVWVPDPHKKEVQTITRDGNTIALGDRQILEGKSILPGFYMKVSDVFIQPDWWTQPKRN